MIRHLLCLLCALAACDDEPNNANSCSETNLDACEYPMKRIASTERDVMITDQSTGRVLPLHVRIPDLPGPLPVYLWSHGGGLFPGGQNQSRDWGETIVQQGYVVIHIGHSALTVETANALCDLASIPSAECVPPSADDEDGFSVALGKALDEKAVLDKLTVLSQGSVASGGPALDLDRVALGGWSGGSRGPQVLMGAKIETTATAPLFSLPDARLRAVVEMSPAGPGFGGFFENATSNSWESMRGPTLIATGTNDQKPNKPELTGAVRRVSYTDQPADGSRHLLFSNLPVGVGGHATFDLEDLDHEDARVARLSRAIRSSVLAFLDANVTDDADAKAWLETQNAKILAGDVDWEHK